MKGWGEEGGWRKGERLKSEREDRNIEKCGKILREGKRKEEGKESMIKRSKISRKE